MILVISSEYTIAIKQTNISTYVSILNIKPASASNFVRVDY